jgi:hypothetical protein
MKRDREDKRRPWLQFDHDCKGRVTDSADIVERDEDISLDEIVDMQIDLETCGDVYDFLERIG